MTAGDIVRIIVSGRHEGRYGRVTDVRETLDVCVVEFEDDGEIAEFQSPEIEFVRRGPFRSAPR